METIPLSTASFIMLSEKAPSNIEGKSVRISKNIAIYP
jgi:hypothetical protein